MENEDAGHISMSDTESTTSRGDSFHSPLGPESPVRSDDPRFQTENEAFIVEKNCKALVPVDMYHSPVPSPRKSNNQAISADAGGREWRPSPHSEKPPSVNLDPPPGFPTSGGNDRGQHLSSDKPRSENLGLYVKGASPMVIELNKLVREEPSPEVKKVEVGWRRKRSVVGEEEEVGREMRSRAAVEPILRRSGRNGTVTKAAMVIRIFEVVACVTSLSVMAADRSQGWSSDSFDRYKEYRYCLAVNVVGFVYSGFQTYNLAYHLCTRKDVISHHLSYHLDFSMDQLSF
ncbi:CASP-like protein 4A3 [Primulina huaijiensis]|uniref:CASP-like protein 4A3 n=1 Tax=Primulina huaijiensis TaxID=1492673 RepID=UPI003CC75FD0